MDGLPPLSPLVQTFVESPCSSAWRPAAPRALTSACQIPRLTTWTSTCQEFDGTPPSSPGRCGRNRFCGMPRASPEEETRNWGIIVNELFLCEVRAKVRFREAIQTWYKPVSQSSSGKNSGGPLDNQTWYTNGWPQQKLHCVCQVWLSSGPAEDFTFSYCAWLWNWQKLSVKFLLTNSFFVDVA